MGRWGEMEIGRFFESERKKAVGQQITNGKWLIAYG
jgi:hypothetical protein